MKLLVFLGSALAGSAAFAQPPSAPSERTDGQSYNPSEIVCVVRAETGTRLGRMRRCATRAQWAEDGRNMRADLSAGQLNQLNPSRMTPGDRAAAAGRYTGPARPGNQ
jgi:hypothetical protein